MINVDYTYYTDVYKGNQLSEEEFAKHIQTATIYMSIRTFGASDKIDDTFEFADRVKYALCRTVDTIKIFTGDDGVEHGVVASESVGGTWSKSYKVSSNAPSTLDEVVQDKLNFLLAGTGLLYGGEYL